MLDALTDLSSFSFVLAVRDLNSSDSMKRSNYFPPLKVRCRDL